MGLRTLLLAGATGRLGSIVDGVPDESRSSWEYYHRKNPVRGTKPKARSGATPFAPHTAIGRVVVAISFGLLLASQAKAAPATVQFDLPVQGLAAELFQLAQTSNIELLFDPNLMAGRKGVAIHGRFTAEEALTKLLSGTDLAYRRTDDGAFVISKTTAQLIKTKLPTLKPEAAPTAVAEILVVGHRSLDADIRRSPDDIQPYMVASSEDIQRSQADTTEEFFRTWLSSDTQSSTLSQAPALNFGQANSQVSLRGLGTDETLVLVDGRRLPQIGARYGFQQPDLNALPLLSIDRIETLSSTAGGIFGPGATGGVVNVVLRGDYQGSYLNLATGETTAGDAGEWRAEGGFGITNPNTGTHITFAFGHTENDGLDIGRRSWVPTTTIPSGAVNITSIGGNLTLLPSLGGASLGSTLTYLPLTTEPANMAAVLLANAGLHSASLAPDGSGALQSLLPTVRTDSLDLKLRQRLSNSVEGFVDVLYLRDQGVAAGPAFEPSEFIDANTLGNPFNQPLFVSFPAPGRYSDYVATLVTDRITAGIIVRLFNDWTADFDVTAGRALQRQRRPYQGFFINVDPFMGISTLNSTIATGTYTRPDSVDSISDTLVDFNFRLGGSLLSLPGGPLSLTLLGEDRAERNPGITSFLVGSAPTVPVPQAGAIEGAQSFYAETRAPLTGPNLFFIPLRALELQAAVRFDRTETEVLGSYSFLTDALGMSSQERANTFSVTAGAKVSPYPGFIFRASVADGYLPPTPAELIPENFSGPTEIIAGGSTSLKPEEAFTKSIGIVVEPSAVAGFRLSVDYTQIVKSHEIITMPQESSYLLLENPELYPERITRGPLTAAEAALGYTEGPITSVNTGYFNDGHSIIDTVDFAGSYRLTTTVGTFEFTTRATWEPNFRSQVGSVVPSYQIAGYSNGPLKWRANGGIAWLRGPWSISLDSQYYDSYHPEYAEAFSSSLVPDVTAVTDQGRGSVKSQIYFDALIKYTGKIWPNSPLAQYRFGMKNIFDKAPPFSAELNAPPYVYFNGYSPYGDPRGRRFEFSVTTHF